MDYETDTLDALKVSSVSPDANIIGGRFIMTLQNFQTPE